MNYGKDFDGLTAAFTGAGSGIGLATAQMLKARGANVTGLDLNEGEMADTAQWIQCDIGDADSVIKAFAQITSLDIFIKNAGISAVGTVETSPDED